MRTFKDVRKYLSNIPNINYGGCGYAALFMYKWIKLHKPKQDVKIVFIYRDGNTYNNNSNIINNNLKKHPLSCNHACILYNSKYIDCEKEVTDMSIFKHEIDNENFVKRSLFSQKKWNKTFDRKWVSIIEQNLNIKL